MTPFPPDRRSAVRNRRDLEMMCYDLREAENGVERGAQLVAHFRRKPRFRNAGGFCAVALRPQALTGLALFAGGADVGPRKNSGLI